MNDKKDPLLMTRDDMVEFNRQSLQNVAAQIEAAYAGNSFWTAYAAYVEESFARHARAIQMLLGGVLERGGEVLSGSWLPARILDLGCGQTLEGARFARSGCYVGVEKDQVTDTKGHKIIRADYRAEFLTMLALLKSAKFEPTTILSLFSIEATACADDNVFLYEKLMEFLPTVQRIITTGFFYRGKEERSMVQETHGLASYQTRPAEPLLDSGPLRETRLLLPAPSKLFGPNVVEVWRLIERTAT